MAARSGVLHRNMHRETWRWEECQRPVQEMKTAWPREEPQNPRLGQGWFDEEADCLYIWDGMEWVCLPTD